MRIPFEWLSEYVDVKGLSVEKASELLNLSGTENEVLSDMKDFPGIVVGEILEIAKHPNADKLNVTKTRVGKEILQIVCGASNIEVGQKVPVALPGATIGEFEIKEVELRGVKSSGMICSEAELGISDDHAGIMVLNPDAKVGESLSKALSTGGVVLEAELTPNRSDCFSVIGIARELAAASERKLKNLNFEKVASTIKQKIEVKVKEENLCPRYIAKVIENVTVGDSPEWLKKRLIEAGIRPINNVVDVTNYVMFEWGQPLHAFDAKKICKEIIVRKAKKDERAVTLDQVERKLSTEDLVIADAKKIIGVAGIMGGANSEVDAKTKTVILEAAVFDRTSVRKTAQRLALRTEASTRFEKGIPLELPEIAIERATQLIVEISKGAKVGESRDVLSAWPWLQHIGVRLSRLQEFLGVQISEKEVLDILKSLGFVAEKFDFKKEARKHVGKPYVFGARFKTHGDLAFDCSYLTDYIYSRIGKFIGYTSLAQYELGEPVSEEELQPGDVLFVNGVIEKSVTEHYFVPDGTGGYKKVELREPKRVGHNALYIGNGRVVHARHYEYDFKNKKWIKGKKGEVVEEPLEVFTANPEYIGARRFVEDPHDYIAIDVPWWRKDVTIAEDIYEEVTRIYGYGKIPSVLPAGRMPGAEKNKEITEAWLVRDFLIGLGFSEIINYSFVSQELLELGSKEGALKVSNPLSKEQEWMRTSLIPTLLSSTRVNQNNYENFEFFEVGKVYQMVGKEVVEEERLGLVSKINGKNPAQQLFRLKGALEAFAIKENLGKLTFVPKEVSGFAKGKAALIMSGKKEIGVIGIINEKKSNAAGLKQAPALAEVKVAELLAGRKNIEYKRISKYPVSGRDLNFVFAEKTTIKEIEEAIPELDILKRV